MQTKLIKTKDYLILIDEEAEIKGTVGLCYNSIKNTWDKDIILYQGTMPDYNYIGFQKIIAYRKLNKEAKELDLSLLPPFEGSFNITKWAKEEHKYNHRNIDELSFILGCEVGYEKSQSKQFTLEDMKKAIEMAREQSEPYYGGGGLVLFEPIYENKYTEEEIIQSLSTQQLPKEFIPEYEYYYHSSKEFYIDAKFEKCSKEQYESIRKEIPKCPIKTELKIITNSEGKEELVGTYKY